MVHHTAAFYESVDQTLDNIAALADQVLHVSGDDMFVPDGLGALLALRVGSASAERARISTPSLQGEVLPDISPVGLLEPESPPAGFHKFLDAPLEIAGRGAGNRGERLQLLVENDGAGSAEAVYGVVFLGDGPVKPDPRGWYTVRATCAAAAVTADAWTNRALTLSQRLPRGVYEVGGLRVQSTSLIAARLVFPGQSLRPGVLGCDANADIADPIFRRGGMGVYGRFSYDQPPSVDLLCDAADNETQEVFLDIRRVG